MLLKMLPCWLYGGYGRKVMQEYMKKDGFHLVQMWIELNKGLSMGKVFAGVVFLDWK